MKVKISRKDALVLLRDLGHRLESEGNHVAAVAVELGRASIKRLPELDRIVYVSPTNLYVEVDVEPEETPQGEAKGND